jgi:putative transposase
VPGLVDSKVTRAALVIDFIDEALICSFGSPEEVPEALIVRSDNGSQFMASSVEQNLKGWGVHRQKTPFHCPEENSVIEGFMRTMKEECLWQQNLKTQEDGEKVLSEWIPLSNIMWRHQSLDHLTPVEYQNEFTHLQPEVLSSLTYGEHYIQYIIELPQE